MTRLSELLDRDQIIAMRKLSYRTQSEIVHTTKTKAQVSDKVDLAYDEDDVDIHDLLDIHN